MSCDCENYPDYCGDEKSMSEQIVTDFSLNDTDQALMEAVNEVLLKGEYAADDIQANGGNYSSIQTIDVNNTMVNFTISSIYTNALAAAHYLAYYLRGQRPTRPHPPRP